MRSHAARTFALGAVVALLTAACGSSSAPKSGTQQNLASAAFAFAACMRNHGVTNFPDPHVSSGNGQTAVSMIAPKSLGSSPAFVSAARACRSILPDAAPVSGSEIAARRQAREHALLAFARCLRSRGVPKFPDPTSQGELSLAMIQAAGVDLHAPAVLPAVRACISLTDGLLTLAKAERAINSTP